MARTRGGRSASAAARQTSLYAAEYAAALHGRAAPAAPHASSGRGQKRSAGAESRGDPWARQAAARGPLWRSASNPTHLGVAGGPHGGGGGASELLSARPLLPEEGDDFRVEAAEMHALMDSFFDDDGLGGGNVGAGGGSGRGSGLPLSASQGPLSSPFSADAVAGFDRELTRPPATPLLPSTAVAGARWQQQQHLVSRVASAPFSPHTPQRRPPLPAARPVNGMVLSPPPGVGKPPPFQVKRTHSMPARLPAQRGAMNTVSAEAVLLGTPVPMAQQRLPPYCQPSRDLSVPMGTGIHGAGYPPPALSVRVVGHGNVPGPASDMHAIRAMDNSLRGTMSRLSGARAAALGGGWGGPGGTAWGRPRGGNVLHARPAAVQQQPGSMPPRPAPRLPFNLTSPGTGKVISQWPVAEPAPQRHVAQ